MGKKTNRSCAKCKGKGTTFHPCGTFPPLSGLNLECKSCKGSCVRPPFSNERLKINADLRSQMDELQALSLRYDLLVERMRAAVRGGQCDDTE